VGLFHWDLGRRDIGDVVEIIVRGSAANVLLMDSSNFSTFSKDGSYGRAYGGLAQRSPVHLTIPAGGHWYVVLNVGELSGQTSVNVRMLPKPLPQAALP
jgi:Domain of unknown function (DUF1883)